MRLRQQDFRVNESAWQVNTSNAEHNRFLNLADVQQDLAQCDSFQHLIICGLPKCGSSLLLNLLDNHNQLSVFPDELRFMDAGCQNMRNVDALVKLLQSYHIRQPLSCLASLDDFPEHRGSRSWLREDVRFNFELFSDAIVSYFGKANTAEQRYFACFLALAWARQQQQLLMTNKPVLVSNSLNNELYMFSWQRMLQSRVRFLWCIRNPFEQYLSLLKTAAKYGQKPLPVALFCQWLKGRYDLLPSHAENVFILRYEDLINNSLNTANKIANFLNIEFQSTMLQPSQNGVACTGRSSRGIDRNGIYHNPELAKLQLDSNTLTVLDTELDVILRRFNYR